MVTSAAPTHVLTSKAVRWGIDTLASRRTHPTFAMYLYLRQQHRAGRLEAASTEEVKAMLAVPGSPKKPYYVPMMDRGRFVGKPLPTYWKAANLAGSWSEGSIFRQKPAMWLSTGSEYKMPEDHVQLALANLLYSTPISALALGAFLLRNDGFVLAGTPDPADVVEGFRSRFDFPIDTEEEFTTLFATDIPVAPGFDWFEPVEVQGVGVEGTDATEAVDA